MIGVESRTRLDDGRVGLAVRDYGGAGVPIVMLHGGGDCLETWHGVAPILRRRFRVIVYDSGGHGYSHTPNEVSMRGLLDEVAAVSASAGLTRPMVVGHSFGAATALRYAAQRPDACAAVVALDPGLWAGGADLPPFDEELIRSRRYGWVGTEEEFEKDVEAWLALNADAYSEERLDVVEAAFRRSHDVGPNGMRRRKPLIEFMMKFGPFVRASENALTADLFDGIACPVLLICADNGVVGDAKPTVEAVAERHPNVQIAWASAGHFLHWEQPDEMASQISAFAQTVPGLGG